MADLDFADSVSDETIDRRDRRSCVGAKLLCRASRNGRTSRLTATCGPCARTRTRGADSSLAPTSSPTDNSPARNFHSDRFDQASVAAMAACPYRRGSFRTTPTARTRGCRGRRTNDRPGCLDSGSGRASKSTRDALRCRLVHGFGEWRQRLAAHLHSIRSSRRHCAERCSRTAPSLSHSRTERAIWPVRSQGDSRCV